MELTHVASPRLPTLDRIIVGLELVLSVGALFGGAMLFAGPDGHLLGLPQSLLEKSPFTSFLVPGARLRARRVSLEPSSSGGSPSR